MKPAMSWLRRGEMALSAPYRIVRSRTGWWECWIFSTTRQGCLGRKFNTLIEAQDFAEKDKAAQREPA